MPNQLKVTCVEDKGGQCVQWLAEPSDPDAVFRCRLFQLSRGNRFVIGDFDMPVGLRFFRDADEDGDPYPF